ncbi:MAG TPA: phospholipase D-like domain-containing protein [Terracidiphilus sp.]|nr:phospholipase D-like domain-containing protein [Terracidiphilus sp.]
MPPRNPTHTPATTYTLITEPDRGLTAIYNLIASAKKSVDITIYELTDITVTSMLGKLAAAGIQVRVILDQNHEKTTNTPAYNHLVQNKVAVHWANPVYFVTHQKTITVDQATSAIMTLNLTPNYYSTSRDFAVITNNAADVAAIEDTFVADFSNASITPPTGQNLVWSPTNARSAITALINGATKSLLLSQEEFSDPGMATALGAALKRGVAVTLVQENTNGEFNSALNALKSRGAKIAVYSSRTGFYIHAKTVLADYGTAHAKLFVGSENFSTDSIEKNRELGLIISDATCMAGVETALTADFKRGTAF